MTKEGDFGSGIFLTVKNRQGQVVDMTNKTATLYYQIGSNPVEERDMTVLNPAANGQIKYTWADGDLDGDGTLSYEVLIEGATLHLTSDRLKRLVRDVLVD